MDCDTNKGRRMFMMNATVHVPIICLDDDDDVGLKIDKDYKMFLDHLIDDNSLGPLFGLNSNLSFRYEVDNGESETREFDMVSGESKRSVVKNKYPMKSRVSQERKRKIVGFKDEIPRASSSLVVKKECIQRDNRLAERRKKSAALLAREQENIQRDTNMSGDASLRDVPIAIAQETIQGDDGLRKLVDFNGESLRSAVPLARAQENNQQDYHAERRKKRTTMLVREPNNIHRDTNMSVSNVESFRDVPLVIAHKRIQRALKFSGSKDASLRDVPIAIAQEIIQGDNKVRKTVDFKAGNLRSLGPMVRDQESNQRDNQLAERRKRGNTMLIREQNDIQQDTNMSESHVESLRDVPLATAQESFQWGKRVTKNSDLEAETSKRTVPFVRAEENIRRANNVMVKTLGHVPLVRDQVDIHRVNNVKFNTSGHAPFVRDREDIHGVKPVQVDISNHSSLVRDQEGIHGVNNVQVNSHVPLVRDQEGVHRGTNVKDNTSGHVPLVRHQEGIQGDHKCERRKRRLSELEPQALRSAVPLVRAEKALQRGEFHVYTSSGVRLVKKEKDIHQDHKVSEKRKRTFSELAPEMLRRNVPLVGVEEDVQRDNVIAEQRKKETAETRTSKIVPVELKSVCETSSIVQLTEKKKNEEERVAVVNKDYMNYLKWLVDSVKDSETTHVANLQNDQSDLAQPVLPISEETTIVHEKDLLVNVKVEQDLESWSDDSDIIAVSDTPFSDGEDNTPFVASKCVIDLDRKSQEDESRSCLFTKELMDVLKKPYNEKELFELSKEASMQKPVTRCRELRKGREKVYATDKLGPSYLQKSSDFYDQYKLVEGVDKVKALKLLRGFFFYLRNCSRAGAFKPWSKDI